MTLVAHIKRLRAKLADNASGLTLAQRRVAHFKTRSETADNPEHPHPELRDRAHKRLHYWREAERKAYLRRHHFRVALKRALRRLRRQRPHVIKSQDGLVVFGGDIEDRLLFAARWARKHWHDYYSEGGDYDENYSLTNIHHDGKRRDCSWWYYEIRRACGIPTKHSEPRFTGSILDEGKSVSRAYAESHIGVAVVYGSDSGFHVGMSTGHGPFTFEHGTPTLNTGHFDEFGSGTEVRYRVLD